MSSWNLTWLTRNYDWSTENTRINPISARLGEFLVQLESEIISHLKCCITAIAYSSLLQK